MRARGVWLVVAAWAVLGGTAARADPPSDVLSYGVFAMQDARIRADARVDGDVGCLFDALTLSRGGRVHGLAAAPAITRQQHAKATGGYYCATLNGEASGCLSLPNPLVATPTIVLVGPASNADVSAARGTKSTSPLPAGAYGRLDARAKAEVTLAGGAYQFEAIDLGTRARLVCVAACTVTVGGRMTLRSKAQAGAAESLDASTAVFLVAGQGERAGFVAKRRAAVRGLVYAPSTDVEVGERVRVAGALVGNRVDLGARARVARPAPAS